ncbi:unnamed protein product, partial [Callosobruchus maculatus]
CWLCWSGCNIRCGSVRTGSTTIAGVSDDGRGTAGNKRQNLRRVTINFLLKLMTSMAARRRLRSAHATNSV